MDVSNLDWIDDEVATVEAWIIQAAVGLLSLFDEKRNQVLRDTQELGPRERAGRVSTALSLAAFLDYLRFLEEEPESLPRPIEDGVHHTFAADRSYPGHVREPQSNRIAAAVRRLGKTVGDWSSKSHELNNYPSPHYLQSLVTLGLYQYAAYTRRSSTYNDPAISRQATKLAEDAFNHLKTEVGPDFVVRHGRDPRDDVSYLVMYHAVRAWDAADHLKRATSEGFLEQDTLWDRIADQIRSQVLAQLAYHDARVGARFRVADLAFAAVLLDRLEGANARQLVRRAIETVASEQSPDGSFASPPAVSRDEEILQISSYDIAFALACLCLNELGRDERELSLLLLPSLARTFRLIQAMKEVVRPEQFPGHTLTGAALAENGDPERALDDLPLTERTYVGWPSDTSRFDQVVTGWSTARVLSLLVRYRDCLLAHRQQLVLSKYDVMPPGALSFPPYWYDFLPALSVEVDGLPSSVDDRLDSICDPTGDQRLTLALKKKLIGPVFRSPHRRPKNSSFLVSGPAGTRKTTLVKGIATSLEWPLLVLTPADFLGENEVMGLHVIGSTIFKDLLRLRRVVVLLEECEELVHGLDVPEQVALQDPADTRSQSDSPFLRAGMLPRLQALRDRRWVIFALSTMSDDVATQLDAAVLREGRFDFHIVMDHPTIDAQCRYIRRELRRGYFSQIQEEDMELVPAYQSLVNKLATDQESIGDPITWSRLDMLIARSGSPDTTSSDRTAPSNILDDDVT